MPNFDEYVWDASLRLYRRKKDDEIVEQTQVEDWIDELLTSLAFLWQDRATDYEHNLITFDEFFYQTRDEIDAMNLAVSAIAFGGVNVAQAADYARVQSLIDEQINYFYNFAIQIRAEKVSEAMIAARLGMYALAGFGVYQNSRVYGEHDAGMVVYRRLLGAADHCDDCVEYASRSWQIIGSLPRIGDSVCRARCHCHFEFSKDLKLLGQP